MGSVQFPYSKAGKCHSVKTRIKSREKILRSPCFPNIRTNDDNFSRSVSERGPFFRPIFLRPHIVVRVVCGWLDGNTSPLSQLLTASNLDFLIAPNRKHENGLATSFTLAPPLSLKLSFVPDPQKHYSLSNSAISGWPHSVK